MMDTIQPHSGPAPEPRRKIALGPSKEVTATPDGTVVQPEEPVTREQSPPPANPQEKAQELELKQQIGEMARTIGELRKQMELQQKEFQLRLQALQAQAQPQQGQFAQGAYAQQQQAPTPQEIDPDQPVTAGQLMEAFSVLPQIIDQQVTAKAIRATWPLTDEHVQQVLARFPEAQRLPEPDQTRFILNAAETLGLVQKGTEQATLQAAASTPQAPQPQANPSPNVQPAPGTVPLVEQPGGSIEEPQAEDEVRKLQEEYDRLRAEARKARGREQLELWKQAEEVADQLTRIATGGRGMRDLFDLDWVQE